jgi:hypothetical protein
MMFVARKKNWKDESDDEKISTVESANITIGKRRLLNRILLIDSCMS